MFSTIQKFTYILLAFSILAIPTNCDNKNPPQIIAKETTRPIVPPNQSAKATSQNAPQNTQETTNVPTTNEPSAIKPDLEKPQQEQENVIPKTKSTQPAADDEHETSNDTHETKKKKKGVVKKALNTLRNWINPFNKRSK